MDHPADASGAVRVLALERLRIAESDFAEAVAGQPRSLHDFRVAIRKLRTTLRLFAPYVADSVGPKSRKRLRRVTHASNAARDFEVFRNLAMSLQLSDRVITRIEKRRRKAHRNFRRAARKEFPKLAESLARSLALTSAYPVQSETFAAVVVRALAPMVAQLADQLALIDDAASQEAAHEARITAKRIRYTLEAVPATGSSQHAIAVLKQMQDDFGRMHDLHVLRSFVAEKSAKRRDAEKVLHELDVQFALVRDKYLRTGNTFVPTLVTALPRL